MIQINALLELRTKIKDKKPDFIRQDYQRRKRLGRKLKWRKPKGIHSKIRHKFKGRRKMPSPGYKSPKKVRGLHFSGFKVVRVFSVDGIKGIKKEIEGAIIPKNVGMKKRFEILRKAKELNVGVLNLNVDEQTIKIENMINSKKEATKEKKKEEIKKEAKQKGNIAEKQIEEDMKKVYKAEKDKVLTKKV